MSGPSVTGSTGLRILNAKSDEDRINRKISNNNELIQIDIKFLFLCFITKSSMYIEEAKQSIVRIYYF